MLCCGKLTIMANENCSVLFDPYKAVNTGFRAMGKQSLLIFPPELSVIDFYF